MPVSTGKYQLVAVLLRYGSQGTGFISNPQGRTGALQIDGSGGIDESLVDRINSDSETPPKPCRKKRNEALYRKLLQEKLDHLFPEERRVIEPVLLKYAHVFHDEETNDFKCTDVIEHPILVGDARPIWRPEFRTPYALRG
jgi:hypothetical protein